MEVGTWIDEANGHPLDGQLFVELWVFAEESLAGERREFPPDEERCLEDLPSGTPVFTDVPMNQMGLGLAGECRRRFPNDTERATTIFMSFMWRFWAMRKALDDTRASTFIRDLATGRELHTAILFAASECPLKRESADFDDSLFARAERIREE